MKYELYTFFTLLICISSACKKNTVETVDDHSSKYYPLEIGNTWIYNMDSIDITGNGVKSDTFNYRVKHQIVDTFRDNENRRAYRVELSFMPQDDSVWYFSRNYQVVRTEGSIIRTDFDLSEIILTFPVREEKLWDGNLLNNNMKSDFFYLNVHQPATYGNISSDSTLEVHQEERVNLIENFTGLEVYAANVGLVYREKYRLKDIHDEDKTSGYLFKMTIESFER
ncbi:hypothetical protein GYB22_05950 [bacterium]|nr:hypothetical protein [bacterium]